MPELHVADMSEVKEFIARFEDGEVAIASMDDLDRCIARCLENHVSEFCLISSTPAMRLASLAGRVFGIQPRPSMLMQSGAAGALVTFFDRPAGDYRVVNREYAGDVKRETIELHNRRRVSHRSDELFPAEVAVDFARQFFKEGMRPWNLSCRPASIV